MKTLPFQPEVSVCIPTYNAEKVIEDTLRSVLNQSLREIEIFILDDGSKDKTLEIVAGFGDPRIRASRNPQNLGAAKTWNRAIKMANGRYVKLLCHDDLLYPACLEEELRAFQMVGNEDVQLVTCKRDFIDAGGRKLFASGSFGNQRIKLDGMEAIRKIARTGTNLIGEPSAVLFRASEFAQTTGFDENHSYLIDLDFWCRLLLKGSLYFVPEALCAFRIHGNSWGSLSASSQASQNRKFTRSLARIAPEHVGLTDIVIGNIRGTARAYLRRVLYWGLQLAKRFKR